MRVTEHSRWSRTALSCRLLPEKEIRENVGASRNQGGRFTVLYPVPKNGSYLVAINGQQAKYLLIQAMRIRTLKIFPSNTALSITPKILDEILNSGKS
jgi:hypothetical protein